MVRFKAEDLVQPRSPVELWLYLNDHKGAETDYQPDRENELAHREFHGTAQKFLNFNPWAVVGEFHPYNLLFEEGDPPEGHYLVWGDREIAYRKDINGSQVVAASDIVSLRWEIAKTKRDEKDPFLEAVMGRRGYKISQWVVDVTEVKPLVLRPEGRGLARNERHGDVLVQLTGSGLWYRDSGARVRSHVAVYATGNDMEIIVPYRGSQGRVTTCPRKNLTIVIHDITKTINRRIRDYER